MGGWASECVDAWVRECVGDRDKGVSRCELVDAYMRMRVDPTACMFFKPFLSRSKCKMIHTRSSALYYTAIKSLLLDNPLEYSVVRHYSPVKARHRSSASIGISRVCAVISFFLNSPVCFMILLYLP